MDWTIFDRTVGPEGIDYPFQFQNYYCRMYYGKDYGFYMELNLYHNGYQDFGDGNVYGGAYDAELDPVIEIDPDFKLNIDGVMVPATEFFEIEYHGLRRSIAPVLQLLLD